MSHEPVIRPMTRNEVDDLVAWAGHEGWNPGVHDAAVFWATDADAFIAAELNGELIGGGAITSYGGEFGFMGFFIVRPEFRGNGFGNTLWHARRDRLIGRLQSGASIGMDGVFDMQTYYARGGFVFSHRDIRYRVEGYVGEPAASGRDGHVVGLGEVPWEVIEAYDRTCFPAPRRTFLRAWIGQPDGLALGLRRNCKFCGYGVIRRCLEGYKIGPLFADDVAAAATLYEELAAFAEGAPVYLDVPANNPPAKELVDRYAMTEVFGCARMYLGPAPQLAHQCIFGVTTFELG